MEVFYCCRPVPSGIGKEYWEIIQANEKAGINESPSVGTYPRCVRFRQQSETKGGEIPPFNCWGVFISDCCRGIGKEYWEIIQANEKAGINESPNVGTYPRCVRFHRQPETDGDGEIQPFNCWDVFILDCCRGIGKAYWEIIQANEKAGINESPSVGTYPRCVRFRQQSETKGGEIPPFNC